LSQIDIKHTKMYIQDGYNGPVGSTPAVNNAAGYAIGATTMVVDGIPGIVEVGDTFSLAGDPTIYRITAHVETTGHTTSITFTPGLVDAATDNEVIDLLPHKLEIKIGNGTLTYNERRKMEYVMNRGLIDTVREGDEQTMEIRLDYMWEFLRAVSGAGTPTFEDALKRRGEAANWISSSADKCEPYSVDLVIEYDPPCTGVDIENIVLPEFRWESLSHDPKAGTVAVTGQCKAKEAIITRYAPAA
jgi:hypothetical protein